MDDLEFEELITVTGGATRKIDPQTELALTKLSSDIKELGSNNTQNQNSQLTMLLAVAIASRLRR